MLAHRGVPTRYSTERTLNQEPRSFTLSPRRPNRLIPPLKEGEPLAQRAEETVPRGGGRRGSRAQEPNRALRVHSALTDRERRVNGGRGGFPSVMVWGGQSPRLQWQLPSVFCLLQFISSSHFHPPFKKNMRRSCGFTLNIVPSSL